ncbi:phosphoserine transaminase [Halothiobacillus sp. DCM-1]|uniref:phosphoserine transaminase n=1 Tax=Halothiobacillus sp. DCM-1 TaxID=3112558 RepID=UPI00324C1B37
MSPLINPNNAHNFSGGPGALPQSVLEQVQQAILCEPDTGLSILGISHRSDWFAGVLAEVQQNIRQLLGIDTNYQVLMLQGGATQQFSQIPMSFLNGQATPPDYLCTGYWSRKVLGEAERSARLRVVWSGASSDYRRLPEDAELAFAPDAPYLHYVSNETVEGLQFHRLIGHPDVPRFCDMSSDFLSRPIDATQFSFIYAHAQKNLGPAGVTLVLLREELLERMPDQGLPGWLDYRQQVRAQSNYNTPPVFAIYVVLLVTRWLLHEIGGLAAMHAINQRKAARLYDLLDASDGFYQGRAAPPDRSLMNVVFTLPTPELTADFLAAAQRAGFYGLNGHRAIGGIRASLYNGLGLPAVEALIDFMQSYQQQATTRRWG